MFKVNLKKAAFMTVVSVTSMVMITFNAFAGTPQEEADRAIELVNIERTKAGMQPLAKNTDMDSATALRAYEASKSFSHTRPDGTSWYTASPDLLWGENLAKTYSSAEEAVAAWLASPTHKANIMSAQYSKTSIQIYVSGNSWYWAEEFGV